jgi:hypothetical protein
MLTPDYYEEVGWIHINTLGMVVTNGRKVNKGADVKRYSNAIVTSKADVDFCCWRCFLKWIFLAQATRNFPTDTTAEKEFVKKMGLSKLIGN